MLKNAMLVISILASFSSLQLLDDKNIDFALLDLNNNTFGNHDTNPEEDENYLFFCNGVPCQNHDVKSVIKEITNEGRYIYFTPEELAQLDFSQLENWQIIRYSAEELNELDIMPEDCTKKSVEDGSCGFGIRREIEFVEFRTMNDPPLLKGVDMNPFTDVLHLELNPPYIENGFSLSSYGCKVQLLENNVVIHNYLQTVNNLNCFFNIPNELQGDLFHIKISTFVVYENITTSETKEIFRFMAEVGTND